MAYFDQVFYCNFGNGTSTGYYAVVPWAATTAVVAGALRRQLAAPVVGLERTFICIIAGTTGSTEPVWAVTRGARNTDGTVTWQECTGVAALNGDQTSTATWAAMKAAGGSVSLGAVIKRNNGASYWICSTAGSSGASEPAWPNDTAGSTRTDGTVTWTCLGVVGNFTGGQAPHARLANACLTNWFAAGNTLYVGDNHAESQATAISITPAVGSAPQTGRIICHNHTGSYPPASGDLTAGATISTTATVNITFNPAGHWYLYGLTFKAGVGMTASVGLLFSSTGWMYFDRCSLQIAAITSGTSTIAFGGSGGTFTLNNTTVSFGDAANYVEVESAQFLWQNTGQVLVSGSAVPSFLLAPNINSRFTQFVLEALDLSQITTSIFGSPQATNYGNWLVKDCKLNAAAVPYNLASPQNSGHTIQYVRSDSSGTAYKSARWQYEGTEITETSITRVGGASDPTGQAQSRKIATTANSQWLRPFKAEPYATWNPTTSANVTVTVYGTINAGALPNNDDIWMEVEYLGSSASPLGIIVTTTKANVLAAGAAVASDGSAWNGGGSGAGWTPFKLVATLSSPQPGAAGVIEVRLRAAKLSTTYYLDPQPVLS